MAVNTRQHTPLKQLSIDDKHYKATGYTHKCMELREGVRGGGEAKEGDKEKEEFGYISGPKVAVEYALSVQISHGRGHLCCRGDYLVVPQLTVIQDL